MAEPENNDRAESAAEDLNSFADEDPLPSEEMCERLVEHGLLGRTSRVDGDEVEHRYEPRAWTLDFAKEVWNLCHGDCCGIIERQGDMFEPSGRHVRGEEA